MEQLTIYDFPHFKEWEAMYNFFSANIERIISFIDFKYFSDSLKEENL